MSEDLEKIKKSLRSVLLSSKNGVRAARLQGEYQELTGGFIEYKKFGFFSLHEFMKSLHDVVMIGYNYDKELTYEAKADSTTKHILKLVSKQKSKPQKKHSSSAIRNSFSVSRMSPPKYGKRTNYSPWSNFSPVSRVSTYRQNSFCGPISVKIRQGNSNSRSVHYYGNKQNSSLKHKVTNIPRLQAKKEIVFPNEMVSNYKNPLNPSPIPTNPKPTTISSQTKVYVPQKKSPNTSTTFKEMFSELLNENKCGIHSVNVNRLYKEKFGEEIPQKYLSKILDGNVNNLAKLNKIYLGSHTKYILHPLPIPTMKSQYQQQIMPHKPLSLSKEYKVIVVSVHADKNKVYVNLVSESAQYRLMYGKIRISFRNTDAPKEEDIVEGAYVITSLNQRARVLSVTKQNKTVFLYNIDIGTTDDYLIQNVRLMDKEAAEYPEFSIECNFDTMSIDKVWSSQLSQRFEQLYSEAELRIKVMQILSGITCNDKENYQHSVIFYNNCGNINAQLLHKVKATSLHKVKTAQKVCEPDEPDKFQPVSVQLPADEYCDLFLVKASCTTEIDACIIGEGYSDKLVDLETSMLKFYQNLCNHVQLSHPLKLGVVYAVMFEDACVRGKLLSIESDVYNFYLVDSGDHDSIQIEQGKPQCIFALTEEFCELPNQILTIALAYLENDTISCDIDILQHLVENYVSKTPVLAHVLCRKKINIVVLYDTTGVNINQACYDLILEEKYLPVLPEFNNTLDCTISYIEHDKSTLFLNCNGEGVEYLKKSSEVLPSENQKQRKSLPSKVACNLYPGKMCLATIGKKFYRVRIEKVTDLKPRGIQAYLVDVGRFEYFSCGSLFKIEDEKLVRMMDQAICCKLSPCTSCSQGDGPQISLDLLTSGFNQKDMVVRLDNKEDGLLLISLWIMYKNNKIRVVLNGESATSLSTFSEIKQETIESNEAFEIVNKSSANDQVEKVEKEILLHAEQEIKSSNFNRPESDSNNNVKRDISDSNGDRMLNQQWTDMDMALINREDRKTFDLTLINIRVEECISPNYLYIICLNNIEKRDLLMKQMCEFYSRSSYPSIKQSDLKKGGLYTVSTKLNGKTMYNRAKVVNFNGPFTSVFYVDIGRCGVIQNDGSVFELHDYFKSTADMVMMAKLVGIEPLGGSNCEWTTNVNERLKKLIIGKKFVAHVMSVSVEEKLHNQKLYHVCLCDTRSDEDIWINDVIVDDWKEAKYVSSSN